MGFVQEFRDFAVKGNVVDMAVGIIVGAAFNKIVQSLVNDIIMPPVGLMIGGVNFRELKYVLKEAVVDNAGVETAAEVAMRWGQLTNTIIEFIIIAFTVFLVVKFMNRMIKMREKEQAGKA